MINHPANVIPEGKFKVFLRKIYHKYIFPYNFKETKMDGNIYRYDFKNGRTIKFVGSQFIDMSSPLRGYLKRYSPKKDDVILDLGAYNSMFAIYSSKYIGSKGKAYVFEPNPKNFNTIKKNIRINKIKNIIPIKGGLWNKKDILEMSDNDSESSIVLETKGKKMRVPVDTLDNFVQKNNLQRIDFIKMDVEGAELEIIDGGVETLKRFHPKLAIASYHIRNGEKTYKEVEKKLRALGYKTTTGFPNHLTTYAWKAK